MLKRLFTPRRTRNQQQVAGRAAQVIEHVIFDVGIDSLVNGTLLLDRRFRPRFYGGMPLPRSGIIAAVAVSELAETAQFRLQIDQTLRGQALHRSAAGRVSPALPVNTLVHGIIREFKVQSAAFRALP